MTFCHRLLAWIRVRVICWRCGRVRRMVVLVLVVLVHGGWCTGVWSAVKRDRHVIKSNWWRIVGCRSMCLLQSSWIRARTFLALRVHGLHRRRELDPPIDTKLIQFVNLFHVELGATIVWSIFAPFVPVKPLLQRLPLDREWDFGMAVFFLEGFQLSVFSSPACFCFMRFPFLQRPFYSKLVQFANLFLAQLGSSFAWSILALFVLVKPIEQLAPISIFGDLGVTEFRFKRF